ncbi:MAG TPA: Uma2 family endonuclease [Cyclobacteriaceae bacterium]|nr:Uma2 family endonuclease [Cyclobacteriaceae bacterium]
MTSAYQNITHPITAIEAFKRLPEGVLAEVIDEVLYVSPSPTLYHQRVSFSLMLDLGLYVRKNQLGEVLPCPTDVYVEGEHAVVIPDIIFISRDNKLIKDRKGIHGPPDLLIEVQSPSTRKRDFTLKKNLYERIGVREYWIVNPDTKDAFGYLLNKGLYGNTLKLNSKIHIRILNKTLHF